MFVKIEHKIFLITSSNKQKTMPAKRSSLPWPVIKPIISFHSNLSEIGLIPNEQKLHVQSII